VSEINNWKFSLDQKRWLSKGFIMAWKVQSVILGDLRCTFILKMISFVEAAFEKYTRHQ
jgi:hypothetical protein